MRDVTQAISPEDYHALSLAFGALEHPGFAARVSNILGLPMQQALRLLPHRWHEGIRGASEAAISRATERAVASLGDFQPQPSRNGVHRALAIGSGAVGGFFGLPGLIVELPVTTLLILRSIADIARSCGEDLTDPRARFACMAVFAFGGRTHDDDYSEIGYYEARAALAMHFSSALDRVKARPGHAGALPATVEIIRVIAGRFGITVTEKAAAHLVPVVSASAAALVNAAFMQHFQSLACGHFTIRALERKYGRAAVQSAYAAMAESDADPATHVTRPVKRRSRPSGGA